MMIRRTRKTQRGVGLIAAAAITMALAGCGSDDDELSAQEQYCEAGASLQSSVEALTNIDLISEGTSGLEDALNAVTDDLSTLRDTADSAAEPEVEALTDSVDELQSSVSDLGGEISADNATALAAAVQSVGSAAQAVYDTLSDC